MTIEFQCPICDKPLHQHQASQGYYCDNKHHFDRSEQGYWVFAKPQKQKPVGDSRQLMRSKRFLLGSGIFSPVIEAVADTIAKRFANVSAISLLDFDAGDGYFLRALAPQLSAIAPSMAVQPYGVIDAENAIFAAAKAQTPGWLCLGSTKKLPFADDNFDLVTVFDKPLKGKEWLRVVKPDGLVLLVIPGPRHLWQLKGHVYPDLTEKPFAPNLPSQVTILHTESVSFTLQVNGEQAITLLEMTPFAWRANDKVRHTIGHSQFDSLEVDYRVLLVKRISA